MKTLDRVSSLVCLFLSALIFLESLRIGPGTLSNPGKGFITLGASGILGVLSIALFLQASFGGKGAKHSPLFAETAWKRILFILVSIFLYARFMPVVGYLISTFILMVLLFGVLEREKRTKVLFFSALSTLATYIIFSKWLNCQFPDGFFGF